MRLSRKMCLLGSSALVLLVAGAAHAEDVPDAKTLVEAKYAAIQTIVSTEKTDAGVRAKVVAVLESFTDFKEFGRLTLKRYWKDLTRAQKTLFVDRYRLLIHKSYVKHFKANKPLTLSFRGEAVLKKGKALVKTLVKSGDTEAEVDYKCHTLDGRWMAYDIVIDEVSLMRSYRKQFGRIMKRDGFDKLIEKIDRKIHKDDGGLKDP